MRITYCLVVGLAVRTGVTRRNRFFGAGFWGGMGRLRLGLRVEGSSFATRGLNNVGARMARRRRGRGCPFLRRIPAISLVCWCVCAAAALACPSPCARQALQSPDNSHRDASSNASGGSGRRSAITTGGRRPLFSRRRYRVRLLTSMTSVIE